ALAWTALARGSHDALLALYAAPVSMYLFMAWFFGRTLRRGRQPLISAMAAHLHPEIWRTDMQMQRYTRLLTAVWTLLFVVLALVNALLALLVSPDGVLELLGLQSPLPVAPALWSLVANFLSFGVVLVLFGVEFAYRRRRF